MKKNLRWVAGSCLAAGLAASVLLPATSASATPGFLCPAGTDTIDVPYGFSADNTALLAGTVCVEGGTTLLNSYDVNKPWKATVKSQGASSKGLDIRFKNPKTGAKVSLLYKKGKTVIK
ncbi:MAG TPA: hypothetical protein VGP36_01825 [Mycobacteriales bacterium]|jgi:hypothetical protein|nr:hypothetical protein [Mycobacteriales bacterium]